MNSILAQRYNRAVTPQTRYRMGRKLGEGGMGVVYAAHDERLDRPVAIKRIRQGADDLERNRLWREARTAASVSHPNICQLYEIEEDGPELFLTMELARRGAVERAARARPSAAGGRGADRAVGAQRARRTA
jgi:serine/threonine protein kinase